MKIIAGLLILAASLQPYVVWGDSETATTAAAAAAASGGRRDGAATGAAAGAASGGGRGSASGGAAAGAASGGGREIAAVAAAAGAASGGGRGSAAAGASARAASGGRGTGAATATAVATATATSLTSAYIHCICEPEYKPVCGCDGKTYSNKCVLQCINAHKVEHRFQPLHVKSYGECIFIPCHCTPGGNPVCGSDGQIYPNECYFKCENTRRFINGLRPMIIDVHGGACKLPTCICPKNINPVCGTDSRTYRNVCILQCVSSYNHANCKSRVRVKCEGVCDKENCNCALDIEPLCCNDGKTYNNRCHLECENRKLNQLGKSSLVALYKGKCVPDCYCPKTYDPVCASNSTCTSIAEAVTFYNRWTLACVNRRRKKKKLPPLVIRSYGECPCKCLYDNCPVCGSDGITYENECRMKCENKRRFDLGLPRIAEKNRGRCECRCGHCPRKYKPVCGSDGRSYLNQDWLVCNRDCNTDIGHRLYIHHNGPC